LRKPFQVGRGGICTSLSVQSAHDCTAMHGGTYAAVKPLISRVVCDQKAMPMSTLTVQLVYA